MGVFRRVSARSSPRPQSGRRASRRWHPQNRRKERATVSTMNFGLDGRVIAITGAASGIGFATASLLAHNGAKVAVLDINKDAIDASVEQIRLAGGEAKGFAVDVRNEAAVSKTADEVESSLGPTYGLVACAGVSGAMPSADLTLAELDRVMPVNTIGVFLTCQAFGREMLARKDGATVAISSISGMGGQAARLSYVTSKWAVNGIIKTLAVEWGRHNVRQRGRADVCRYARGQNACPEKLFRRNVRSHANGPWRIAGRNCRSDRFPAVRRCADHHGHRDAGRRRHNGWIPDPKERRRSRLPQIDRARRLRR